MLSRTEHIFKPNEKRVIAKLFKPGNHQKIHNIFARVQSMTEGDRKTLLNNTRQKFNRRHRDIQRIFKDNFEKTAGAFNLTTDFSLEDKLLIGSFFTMEYSIESAGLFNPSIVVSPNQHGVKADEKRIIISFRAVGEGHISSLVFRQGLLSKSGKLSMVGGSTHVEEAMVFTNPSFNKSDFARILEEKRLIDKSKFILEELLENFTLIELKTAIDRAKPRFKRNHEKKEVLETILWLANSNYEIHFFSETKLSERVIFPISENEKKGLEDARFVQIQNGNLCTYYATYTAYSGSSIVPQLIETTDFVNFKVNTLHGEGAQNKGMALFPEKINGKFCMISRQDAENMYIMYSDNILFWDKPLLFRKPEYSWEAIQIGNCGSPVKTDSGWILLTHGVGPVREYCIGALLLDLEDPSKIIGELKEPLLIPDENERNGYVPNVVYTCGALLYGSYLHIPYAMSDSRSSIATINVSMLLKALKNN